jgi:hypothetical protein
VGKKALIISLGIELKKPMEKGGKRNSHTGKKEDWMGRGGFLLVVNLQLIRHCKFQQLH